MGHGVLGHGMESATNDTGATARPRARHGVPLRGRAQRTWTARCCAPRTGSRRAPSRAVRALAAAGVPFALATGRMPSGVEGIAERLGVPTYRICYSGAYVTGPDGAQIASQTLPLEVAREVLGVMSSLWPWLAPSYFAGPHWFAEDPRRPRRPGRGGRRAGAARAGELRRAARRGSRAQQAVLPRGLPPRARRGDTPRPLRALPPALRSSSPRTESSSRSYAPT